MSNQVLRAIIWLAVSTQAQADDDKASLPQQEKDTRILCENNGWEVADVLEVPGHSRRYVDIYECARDMRAEGIDAFDRLLSHWDNKDFDVIVVRDGSRFARTQTLHSYVVERTIEMDARIYSLQDGWIDNSNYRMWIAMGGYSAAGEIDNLVKRRKMGFDARVQRGLPANHSVPRSHRIIRDPKSGKAVRVELREELKQVWDDLAILILEGESWRKMGKEMFERFGHGNELGEPYSYNHYHRLVNTPAFWGHTARNFKHKGRGAWVHTEGESIPDGILINYHVHPPVWQGELADKIKSELRRRETISKGRAKPSETKPFSGLLICGECGYNLTYSAKGSWEAWRCMSRWEKSFKRTTCTQTSISLKKIRAYIDDRLRQMLEAETIQHFFPDQKLEKQKNHQRVREIRKNIQTIEKTLRRIILDKAKSDDANLLSIYESEIENHIVKLNMMKKQLKQLENLVERDDTTIQQRAYEDIAQMSVDVFWQQENTYINQILHRLIGRKRFVVLNGEFVGIVDAPIHKKRYEGK